jgi:hypothetical protein
MSAGQPDWQARLAAAVARPTPPLPGQQGPRVSSARLAIYRNNALAPLVQALEDTLPACRWLLGADTWRSVLLDFVRAQPPDSPILRDYGAALPAWLAARQAHPALCELAMLELALVRCWHAAEAPVLAAKGYAELQAHADRLAGLRLELHPAARLLRCAWPAGSLWLDARRGGDLPTTPGAGDRDGAGGCGGALPAEARPEAVLVARREWTVEVRLLSPGEDALLHALAAGQELVEALGAGLDAGGDSDAGSLLATLVDSRAFRVPAGISAG